MTCSQSTANLDGVASKAPLSRHHREVSVSDISSIGLGARAPGAIQPLEDDIRGLPGNPVLVAGACAVMGTLVRSLENVLELQIALRCDDGSGSEHWILLTCLMGPHSWVSRPPSFAYPPVPTYLGSLFAPHPLPRPVCLVRLSRAQST